LNLKLEIYEKEQIKIKKLEKVKQCKSYNKIINNLNKLDE
jgi:hypothetical protein